VLFSIALSLVLGAALFGLIAYGYPPLSAWYLRRIEEKKKEVSVHLSELFLTHISAARIAHLLELRIPLTALIVYAITSSWLFTGGAAVVAYFAPPWIFRFLKTRRLDRFDEQLVDAVNVLASSARAGLSLVQAIEAVALNMPPPVSQEFGLLLKEYEYGTSVEKILESARERLKRPNFSIVATAIIVNREKGGNLVEVLDKIGSSVREIFRLEKKIKTETASVRFSAKLMAAMPMVIGIIFYFIEPSSMELLFTDPVGTVILFFVIVLNVVALVIIRRIVNVEV
jgi:tight adherence protein B